MNVASLELCKELYKLSGWKETDKWYCLLNDHSEKLNYELEDDPIVAEYITNGNIPAYDLSYLLRKLQHKEDRIGIKLEHWANKQWQAVYPTGKLLGRHEQIEERINGRANTPEDAAAKLAIELFHRGILTREGEKSNG